MLAILLAASLASSQQALNLEQVDARLSAIVYSARGGWLFHQLSHLICQNAARQNYITKVMLQYQMLEREYVVLGGTFLPDDEQEIMLEPYHTRCATGRASEIASRWQVASDNAERELQTMQGLLERKRQLTK